jgi:hypothetical protein
MTRVLRTLALIAVVSLTAAVSLAQTSSSSTTETKSFTIIGVQGNALIVRLPEGTKELDVPPDFRFMVNGKAIPLSDLKAGMKGTATVTTTTTVIPVTVTEVKNGTVMQRSGSSIIVRTADGIKMFSEGELDKRGVKMIKNGQPAELSDFHEGDKLSATIVTSMPPKVMTAKEVSAIVPTNAAASGSAAPAMAKTSSSGAKAPASASRTANAGSTPGEPAKKLPKTASTWPLLLLASAASLAIGLGLTITRRLTD